GRVGRRLSGRREGRERRVELGLLAVAVQSGLPAGASRAGSPLSERARPRVTAALPAQRYRCMSSVTTAPRIEPALRDATILVLREQGWDGLTLERVADVAGRARSTLWRRGVTRDLLVGSLIGEVAADFKGAMFPILTSPGSGRDRLERCLEALCDLIDRHLPLMLATDEVFHQPPEPGQPPDYLRPLIQFLREGEADGSPTPRAHLREP